MTTFISLTTTSAGTRVEFYPPMTDAREIQLSNIHGIEGSISFENDQEVYKHIPQKDGGGGGTYLSKARGKNLLRIPSGEYTLDEFRSVVGGIFGIHNTSVGIFLTSREEVIVTKEFHEKLGVPELLLSDGPKPIVNFTLEPMYVCCDLVDTKYSRSNFRHEEPSSVKIHQSDLLAVYPSKEYPSIPIRQVGTNLLIDEFFLSIFDKNGKPRDSRIRFASI